MLKQFIRFAAVALTATGCATSFTGDPHIENGRSGCEAKCRGEGMALAGMVFMGEYTSGCVCAVPGQTASTAHVLASSGAQAGGAAAGVVMQMRRQQEQQQRATY
jgi:hypothetical protein